MFLPILLVFVLCIIFVKWKFTYWERKNVPCIDTWSIWGNLGSPISRKEFLGVIYANIYHKFKKAGKQHAGVYGLLSSQYLPIDLNILKRIIRNDFDHFQERGLYYNEKDDPVSAHVLTIGGEKWKTLRTKISPVFTKAKVKGMFNIIMECAKTMNLAIESKEIVDIKNLSERFTIDVIGSCGFGIECNSFGKSDFDHLRKFNIFDGGIWTRFLFAVANNFPKFGWALRIPALPKNYSTFFQKVTEATLAYRRSNPTKRNDVFQALMELDTELTFNEMSAQCFVFFIAGFRTSSSTLAYSMYELSRNPDIQEKARKEVLLTMSKYNGEITFEAIQEMKYLEQVISETLRKYPPLAIFTRTCTKDYKIPNLDLIIEEGTRIIVPILGIHNDEEYYPQPEKFDPDRFSEQNIGNIHKFAYLPFGDGPRVCLGRLFAMNEVKLGLSMLLKDYIFAVNPKVQHPLRWDALALTLQNQDPIWLDIQKIST